MGKLFFRGGGWGQPGSPPAGLVTFGSAHLGRARYPGFTVDQESVNPSDDEFLATWTYRNDSGVTDTNVPVRWMQHFPEGEVPAGWRPQLRGPDGETGLPCQIDQWSFRPDGSLCYCVIRSRVPSVAAGSDYQIQIWKENLPLVQGQNARALSSLKATNAFEFEVRLTNMSGSSGSPPVDSTYITNLFDAIDDNELVEVYAEGDEVKAWEIFAGKVRSTTDGTAHPTIEAHWYLEYHEALGALAVTCDIEQVQLFETHWRWNYDATIFQAGLPLRSWADIPHIAHTLWNACPADATWFWAGRTAQAGSYVLDRAYLRKAHVLPPFDDAVNPPDTSVVESYGEHDGVAPNGSTDLYPTGAIAARHGIDVAPGKAGTYDGLSLIHERGVRAFLSNGKNWQRRARCMALAQGHLPMNHREGTHIVNFAVPTFGHLSPSRKDTWYREFSKLGNNVGDSNDVPSKNGGDHPNIGSVHGNWPNTHHPELATYSWSVEGDQRFLRRVHFNGNGMIGWTPLNNGYRTGFNFAGGAYRPVTCMTNESRGNGWVTRSMLAARAMTPQHSPSARLSEVRAYLDHVAEVNFEFIDARFQSLSPNHQSLGLWWHQSDESQSVWQQAFLPAAIAWDYQITKDPKGKIAGDWLCRNLIHAFGVAGGFGWWGAQNYINTRPRADNDYSYASGQELKAQLGSGACSCNAADNTIKVSTSHQNKFFNGCRFKFTRSYNSRIGVGNLPPPPFNVTDDYFVRDLDISSGDPVFRLAATPGGPAITFEQSVSGINSAARLENPPDGSIGNATFATSQFHYTYMVTAMCAHAGLAIGDAWTEHDRRGGASPQNFIDKGCLYAYRPETPLIPPETVEPEDLALLLNFDGADGAAETTDESTHDHSVIFVGSAQLDTAQVKFGSASLRLDGNGYLRIPFDPVFAFAGNDWTVEFWARYAAIPSAGQAWISLGSSAIGELSWMLFWSVSEGAVRLRYSTNGTDLIDGISAPFAPDTTDWHHFAGVRAGNELALYANGQKLAFGFSTDPLHTPDGVDLIVGGRTSGAGIDLPFNGWLDSLRIANKAIYTGPFTPPTQPF